MLELVVQVRKHPMRAYCRLRRQNNDRYQATGESGTWLCLTESKFWRAGNMKQHIATVGMVLNREARVGGWSGLASRFFLHYCIPRGGESLRDMIAALLINA